MINLTSNISSSNISSFFEGLENELWPETGWNIIYPDVSLKVTHGSKREFNFSKIKVNAHFCWQYFFFGFIIKLCQKKHFQSQLFVTLHDGFVARGLLTEDLANKLHSYK